MATYLIEGIWSGPADPASPRSNYPKRVQVSYMNDSPRGNKWFIHQLRTCPPRTIKFTDGTYMQIFVTNTIHLHAHQMPPESGAYFYLIDCCVKNGIWDVEQLPLRGERPARW